METTAALRGVSLSIPPTQPPRMEWRAVSDHSSRTAASEVQQGRESSDLDFCSIAIDEGSDNDNLQQQLYTVDRQREDLQRLQIELRARIVARSGLMEMQKTFDDQFKEHANAYAQLQEQLHQKEQALQEFEKRIEEKDRDLHAIKLENEAAWAKEGLLREQNNELQTFRRERDNSEAERSQHIKQIHELQEHIQDRERQLLELQEQLRVAQETIMYKDEQLREAQAWISRVQEMDALQSTANHNLQAELRERTEQYNQLWLACQRQFAEVERLHFNTVQQLQLELADARERIGNGVEESRVSRANSNDSSQIAQKGNQLEANGSITSTGNSGVLPNGKAENLSSYVSTGNASTQAEHVHGVAIAPSTMLEMSSHLPLSQVAHPFIMHQQGSPNSAPALVSQSHVAQFQSVPAVATHHWQNQQASAEGSQLSSITKNLTSQNSDYEAPANGQIVHPGYMQVHFKQGSEDNTVNPPPAEVDKTYLDSRPSQESLLHISSQFHDALRLDALPLKNETEKETTTKLPNQVMESQGLSKSEQTCSPTDLPPVTAVNRTNNIETAPSNGSSVASSEAFVSSGQKNKVNIGISSETALLDERSLLACIVRTLPPGSGGRISISSTLPNRLGKMLAPLHWHDYKKKYGKLNDFITGHSELFLIEGDYIQLREGAQEEIIAATAAFANVAAAAKTASSYSTISSVAVTPISQSYRPKRDPSFESNHSHHSAHSQLANGHTNVKVLVKPKDTKDLHGGGNRHLHSHGNSGANSGGKQQERRTGVASNSRR